MKKLHKILRTTEVAKFPELQSLWKYYEHTILALDESRLRVSQLKEGLDKLKQNKKVDKDLLKTSKLNLEKANQIKERSELLAGDAAESIKNWASLFMEQNGLKTKGKSAKKLESLLKQYGSSTAQSVKESSPQKKNNQKNTEPKKNISKTAVSTQSRPKPEKKASGTSLSKKESTKQPSSTTSKATDNLKTIPGIGAKIEELLKNAGIQTFKDLASTNTETLSEILAKGGSRFSLADPSGWPAKAKELMMND